MIELLIAIYIPLCSDTISTDYPMEGNYTIRRIAISPSVSEYYIPIQDLTHLPQARHTDLRIQMISRPCFTYVEVWENGCGPWFNPDLRSYVPVHYPFKPIEITTLDPLIPPPSVRPFQK